ncbi:MAG: PadR family transcriptional regulator [Candidatus Aminicenantes bacterium]|nr:PadR family transcriptional regulator [Candidatus Aminicenantes bacterium]
MKPLTVPEEILLTAILRLEDNAYGVTIRKKIAQVTGQDIGYGTLYNILAQLVRKGYVSKSRSAPTSERGGRSKIFYRLTASGLKALLDARLLQKKIWKNFPDLVPEGSPARHD